MSRASFAIRSRGCRPSTRLQVRSVAEMARAPDLPGHGTGRRSAFAQLVVARWIQLPGGWNKEAPLREHLRILESARSAATLMDAQGNLLH